MPLNITIVVQALLFCSCVNALFQEGFYLEPKYSNYFYACPKLFKGLCTTVRLFDRFLGFKFSASDICYDGCSHYLEPKDEKYSYACPKLYEGVCTQGRLLGPYGFYYNTCDLCYDGCTQYIDGRYNCRECRPGRWGQWCQYSCIPCSECNDWPCEDFCTERNDTTACGNSKCHDRCTVGFHGRRKSEHDDCSYFCNDCRHKQCHRCKSGFYMYVKNGTQICKDCPTGSISCRLDTFHNNTIQAISCNIGYYLHGQDGLTRCKGCPDECESCRLNTFNNNTVQCTSCKLGHYFDFLSQVGMVGCSACPQDCEHCRLNTLHNNTLQCTRSCDSGFYLETNYTKGMIGCSKCPPWSEECKLNIFQNNTIRCIHPAIGYYLNISNQEQMVECSKFPDHCTSCKLYTFHSKTTINCTSCFKGYYLYTQQENPVDDRDIGQRCVKCPVPCETCILQPNSYYVSEYIKCTSCEQGYYFNYNNGVLNTCTQCPNGCQECVLVDVSAKKPNCTRCEDGFSLQIKDRMGECTSCKQGYFFNYKNDKHRKCIECPNGCRACELVDVNAKKPNCTRCEDGFSFQINDRMGECTSCKQGYFFNNTHDGLYTECTLCPDGCSACELVSIYDEIPNCTRCGDGFSFQIKDGMRQCGINTSRWEVSFESIVTILSIVTVSIVVIGVACFKKRQYTQLKGSTSVTEETKGPERSIGRSKDDDEWQAVGEHIYYNPRKEIGKGSKAVVYEGRYGRNKIIKIAVKAIRCTDYKEAEEYNSEIKNMYREIREIRMIETLIEHYRHPNIVDLVHSLIDINTLYIAFELGKGTLVEYVNVSNESWRKTLKCAEVNRGISEGLRYVHEKGIVHRDLKPANIFIVARCDNLTAVIGDFGTAKPTAAGSWYSLTGRMGSSGYIAPEIYTILSQDASKVLGSQGNRKSDIFSAAILFYYTLSLGDHPFGNEMTAQDSIQNGITPLYMNNKFQLARNSYAYQSLIESMLKPKPEERLTAAEVCSHPANWTEQQIMDYLKDKSDKLKKLIEKDPSKAAILEDIGLIPTVNWMKNLPVKTRTYFKNYKVNKHSSNYLYRGKETNVRALLRAIRNTNSHHAEYPPNVQKELGDYPGGHLDMWLRVCPRLLMHVFTILGPP